ncbi:MAG: tetratricopeptide repeat protein [Rhodovarius sp.]|nr:tetratricopeptide repeat protein [Rhodovarius sp.]
MNHAPPLRLALAALAEGRTAEALPLLHRCLSEGSPEEAELARLNLGMALMDLGRVQQAAPLLEAAAAALPSLAEPRFRLGQIAALRGDTAAARRHFEAALAREPCHVMSLVGLAALRAREGAVAEALSLLDTAVLLAPQDHAIRIERARLAGPARREEVLALLDAGGVEAARLAARLFPPETFAAGEGWPWRAAEGLALLAAGREEEGFAALRLALVLSADAPEMLAELGARLLDAERHGEALPLLQRALAARPWDVETRSSHAVALFRLQRFSEAEAALTQALRDLGPRPALLGNLALTLNAQGRQEEALAAARAAGEGLEALICRIAVQPYHPTEGSAAALAETARAIGRALPAPEQLAHPPGFDANRRLRLGVLSGNLGRHPVGWLTLAGFENLPREEFEIVCFSLRRREDPLARRFRAMADRWHEVGRLSDAELLEVLRAEHCDILIDCGGYGSGGRMTVLARRAAPVQIKWVGAQAATTGMPAIDWMLTDCIETPPGSEAHYTERLLRLPEAYVCYTAPADAPPVGPLPALTRGHLTFGCFNNLAKVTPAVLATWARILAALPGSRLVLRTAALGDPAVREALLARARAAGLDPARLELHGPVPHRELLAAYNGIDIALDPFPYTGGLTALEALYMGVPLIALAGSSFAGRHALSHLTHAGLADWVSEDEDGYVARAIAAAADLPALAALRAGLRDRLSSSPLMDGPRFGRHLAQALRFAWHQRCREAGAVYPAPGRM